MRVCLIQPPANLENRNPCLPDDGYGLGILILSQFLRSRGIEVETFHFANLLREGLTVDELVELIAFHKPTLVGISLNWLHFSRGCLQLAQLVKRRLPEVKIVVGGHHATLFAEEILTKYGQHIDAVAIGEAEKALWGACQTLASKEDLGRPIPGFVSKDPSGEIRFSNPELMENLEELPPLSYISVKPPKKKYTMSIDPDFTAAFCACRGKCPRNCKYCLESHKVSLPTTRPALVFHSPSWIIRQIEKLLREGINSFTVQDPLFVCGDEAILALSKMIEGKKIKIKRFNLSAEPGSLGREGLQALARCAEYASIDYGVETGSEKVAAIIGRMQKNALILDAINAAIDAGISVRTWWMTGLPGDNPETLKEMEEFIVETMSRGAVPRWITPLILFPHTELYRNAQQYGIKPLFHTFEDFMRFSDVRANPLGVYPDLITHETDELDKVAIVKYTFHLKEYVVSKLDILRDFYDKNRLRESLNFDMIKYNIVYSFF